MPNVLITAFEPYAEWKQNSSWLALLELTKDLPEIPRVVTRLYPVDFAQMQQRLEEDLKQNYDFAIHLGQAPGSTRIRLEAIGLNIGGATSQLPEEHRPLVAQGPAAYQSELPLSSWASRLRFASIPAAVSYHAGTYLCNALLYLSLHLAKTRALCTKAAFIHLPLAPVQVVEDQKDMPTMLPETSAKALKLILAEIAQGFDGQRTFV